MQQLLTEAYAEFELDEPAEVPGSVYVEHNDKVCDGREAARAKDAADAAERLKMLPMPQFVEEETTEEENTEEETVEEELYYESEHYHSAKRPKHQTAIHGFDRGIQANQHQHKQQQQQQQKEEDK